MGKGNGGKGWTVTQPRQKGILLKSGNRVITIPKCWKDRQNAKQTLKERIIRDVEGNGKWNKCSSGMSMLDPLRQVTCLYDKTSVKHLIESHRGND